MRKMCTQKPNYSQELYNKYKRCCVEYIVSTALPSIEDKHDEFMLREFVRMWENHTNMVRLLSKVFAYLDKYFIKNHELSPLKEVGVSAFYMVYKNVKSDATKAVIDLIDKEREGGQIDRSLLKNVLNIFVEIGMGDMVHYKQDFEVEMLKDTTNYYKRKATIWIESDSCPDYMQRAEGCLKRERERVSHYLRTCTEKELLEIVQHELLVNHLNQLLENEHSGCRALLRDDKLDDLSRMYRFCPKIPKLLDPIVNVFKQHITYEITTLVQLAEETAIKQVLVTKFIELHDKSLAYVNNCFMNHTLFHEALPKAFDMFCNKTVAGSSSAELLSSFCDNILKKGGSEKMSDEAIEETLKKVVKLVALISDKDLFAEFYGKKLARRLLFDKSAYEDHEKYILRQLREQCGRQFTSKMDGMVTDLTLARETQLKFKEYLNENPDVNPGIELTVTVLTAGSWPSYKSIGLRLPSEMVKCVEVFKGFYETRTKHRKLTWIYSLGTCNVIGKFDPKNIELIISTHQAAALLLFNTADKLSYSEIQTQLGLADEVLVPLLHSLSCAKYKIIVKEPSTETVSQNDSFVFNSKFADKMKRIKVPLPPVDEKKKIIEYVDTDRRYAIDAAIVRIMKSRKVLDHQTLVLECVEQLAHKFKPDIKAIKMRIEDLSARDYMERDKEKPSIFRYLD